MDGCFPAVQNLDYELKATPDFEALLVNYSDEYYYSYYDNMSFAEPCHTTYCTIFGSLIPAFLAIAGCLGLLGNLPLGISLFTEHLFWDRQRPGKVVLSLLVAASASFSATLLFFAAAFRHRWIFGGHFCRAARVLKYGGPFAQALLVAAGSARAPSGWYWPSALWATGFVLATPAAVISAPGDACVSSQERYLWLWAHVLILVTLFLLLPLAMALAKATSRGLRCCRNLHLGVTWAFYLFWAPYAAAMILDMLLRENLITPSCHLWEVFNYFLGFSEALGVSHCFLCPLLILSVQRDRQALNGRPCNPVISRH